ncbi:MAG: SURF1 family protein [Gammaproteobacteria bacterium]|nr:SURF1 family protein [Gammaproteobacteria bacterium]
MPLSVTLGRRELRSRWWALLLTLAAITLFGALGRWQWQRAAEKRAMNAAFAAGGSVVEALGSRATATLPRYQLVALRGRYDVRHQFLLDNINRGPQAGYEVLTPLQLQDGRWLLVNRGWLPLVAGGRERLPDIGFAADAERTVRGRLDQLPVTALSAGRMPPAVTGAWPRLTSFPRTAELALALGHALEPRQLLLAAGEPDGYRRDWRSAGAVIGPERHLAYAVQWWGLALLALVLFVVMNLRSRPT